MNLKTRRLMRRAKKTFLFIISVMILLITIMLAYASEQDPITYCKTTYNGKIYISEIMFNPYGSDTGREWIEIYSNETLEKYKLYENDVHHTIMLCANSPKNINDEEYNLSEYNLSEYNIPYYQVISSSCETFMTDYPEFNSVLYKSSFSLSNSGEYIAIRSSDLTLAEKDYADHANIPEDYSVQYYFSYSCTENNSNNHNNTENNTTQQQTEENTDNYANNNTCNITCIIKTSYGLPSPGKENTVILEVLSENNTIENNTTTNNNTISENNTQQPDNIIGNNIGNNTGNNNISNNNKCNLSLDIYLKNHSIMYNNKEAIKFYNTLESVDGVSETDNYSIEYWVEDLFGNILKDKKTTANLNQKSYTPSIDEPDKVLMIKNRLIYPECSIKSERMIIVTGQGITCKQEEQECTCPKQKCPSSTSSSQELPESTLDEQDSAINLKIEDDILYIDIYKGNTRKYVVNIIIKEGRKNIASLKINLLTKYSSAAMQLPLTVLDIECMKQYNITAEGLDEESLISYTPHECKGSIKSNNIEAGETVNAETTIASETFYSSKGFSTPEKPASSQNNTLNNTTYSHPGQLTGKVIFESPNKKNQFYSLYGLIALGLAGLTYAAARYYMKHRKLYNT